MIHSFPTNPIFGSKLQKVFTAGDPSAFDTTNGIQVGAEPFSVFCNEVKDKVKRKKGEFYRRDRSFRRKLMNPLLKDSLRHFRKENNGKRC